MTLTIAVLVLRMVVTPSAQATLTLFALSPTERHGCLIGANDGATVWVDSVVVTPDPTATRTRTVAREPCPPHTLGRVHSHPGADRCWYLFPGTSVETSDAVAFRRGGYGIDAIVCGDRLVWMARGDSILYTTAVVQVNEP
jgi:hypothetical protein